MGRAKAGDAWMTVMGNVNAVAVAVLARRGLYPSRRGRGPRRRRRRRADMEEVSVLRSGRTAYELAAALERVLQQEG